MSELQRDRFEDLLRALTAERAAVRDAMTFSLDNAACAAEVVDILHEALTLPETPIPTKASSHYQRLPYPQRQFHTLNG